jgi:hypothetical protein
MVVLGCMIFCWIYAKAGFAESGWSWNIIEAKFIEGVLEWKLIVTGIIESL